MPERSHLSTSQKTRLDGVFSGIGRVDLDGAGWANSDRWHGDWMGDLRSLDGKNRRIGGLQRRRWVGRSEGFSRVFGWFFSMGLWRFHVRMRESLRFAGKLMSATVSRVADRWFVSITVDAPDTLHLPL